MRPVTDALGRKEQRAGGVCHAGFIPFTGQDVSPGGTDPVPKQSFVTRAGNQGCGVGYYKG